MSEAPDYDRDPEETREWLESLQAVLELEGKDRARFLIGRLMDVARRRKAPIPPVRRERHRHEPDTAHAQRIPQAQLMLESAVAGRLRIHAHARVHVHVLVSTRC